MPTFRVSIDATKYVEGVHELQRSQLPYAMARTLTMCAQEGMRSARLAEAQRFTLRNKWTQNRTLYKPAEKRNQRIEAMVFTDTQNRRTGARDYMGRHETGGTKTPWVRDPNSGTPYVPVPAPRLRQMFPTVIPEEWQARNLIGAVGGRYTHFTRKGAIQLRSQRQTMGFVFFIQDWGYRPGSKLLMGRHFTERSAYVLYFLIRSAKIKADLDLEAAVQSGADDYLPVAWRRVWADIMVKGLKIKI